MIKNPFLYVIAFCLGSFCMWVFINYFVVEPLLNKLIK